MPYDTLVSFGIASKGLFYWNRLTLMPAGISNHIPGGEPTKIVANVITFEM